MKSTAADRRRDAFLDDDAEIKPEEKGQSVHVPDQYMEALLKSSAEKVGIDPGIPMASTQFQQWARAITSTTRPATHD